MHPKPTGDEWMKRLAFLLKHGHPTKGHVMLIGDSIVYNFFHSSANRIVFEEEIGTSYIYPPAICDTDIVQVGTNDVNNHCSNADEITSGIMQVVSALFTTKVMLPLF